MAPPRASKKSTIAKKRVSKSVAKRKGRHVTAVRRHRSMVVVVFGGADDAAPPACPGDARRIAGADRPRRDDSELVAKTLPYCAGVFRVLVLTAAVLSPLQVIVAFIGALNKTFDQMGST